MTYATTFDIVNAAFEFTGAAFICLSIHKVMKDKVVAGVSWMTLAFFAGWGVWNLWYYPSLEQWASFAGGVALTTTNVAYVVLLIYYSRVTR